MNPQIERLLIQSGLQPYDSTQAAQILQFAEFLVKECAGVTDNHLIPDYPITGAVYDGIQSKKILEYFGVES
jgi:hypothetical protein